MDPKCNRRAMGERGEVMRGKRDMYVGLKTEDGRLAWRKQRQEGEKKGSALFITPCNCC